MTKVFRYRLRNTEFNFYSIWFGKGEISTAVDGATRTALLVGDSYGYSMRWLLAKNYARFMQTADFTDSVPEQIKDKENLSSRIDKSNSSTIYIVSAPYDMAEMMRIYPSYFS